MGREILIGDIVKWVNNPNKIYTVLEIEIDGMYRRKIYRVTHPDMITPEIGMWIGEGEIIHLFQKRDVKDG